MTKHRTVLFRVDAGRRWGSGHLMRCLALAHALKRAGVRPCFLTNLESGALEDRVRGARVEVLRMTRRESGGPLDARDTLLAAHRLGAGMIILDGWQFSPRFQSAVQERGARLMLIDDHGKTPSPAEIILNQNLHASASLYWHSHQARLLLGPRYCLLRPEFDRWRGWARPIAPQGKRILITMGGSDPEDSAGKALSALNRGRGGLEIVVVVGEHYRFARKIERDARSSPHRVRIISGTDRMAKLMAWADLGVTTFGTTSWEMAFMGLPAVSLVVEAHQQRFARAIAEQGATVKIGLRAAFPSRELSAAVARALDSRAERRRMSRRGRILVDGDGGARVVSAMGYGRPNR